MTEHLHKHTPTAEQDEHLEAAIAVLLRVGVIAAAVLVAIGGVMVLRHPGAPVPNYRVFHAPGEPSSPVSAGTSIRSIAAVFRHLRHDNGAGIIALGLLLLIATPIARVVFAVIGFARERDMIYTIISLIVLAVLAFSLIHGG